jgi:uncharacterized membrane protein
MWTILGDLVIGVVDFVLDVLLFRGQRRKRGLRTRELAQDAYEVARFDFLTLTLVALACAGVMLLLNYGLGLAAGWSVGIGIVLGVIWGLWRYFRMVGEP